MNPITLPGFACFNKEIACGLNVFPEPFGGAPGAPGIDNSQDLIENVAFNGISGGYLANKRVSFLHPFSPSLAAPQYNDGSGRRDTRNLKVPKEAVLFVTELFPDTVIEHSFPFAGLPIQYCPDLVKLTPLPERIVWS